MSFKEVLEITPKLSSSDLSKMEKSLGSRFANVAKKFGKGLTEVLTGGSILAAGAALVERLLNPLQTLQQAIDRTLEKGSDINAHAKQFGASPGELAKLHAFGAAKGVGDQELNLLIERFQSAVVQAKFNPQEHSAVRNYVGQNNAVQGFFDFIQNLQKLTIPQQVQVQEEIFGQKQTLKMSEFLHANFEELQKRFQGVSIKSLDKAVNRIDALDEADKANKAYSNLKDVVTKGHVLNGGIISARNTAEEQRLNIENEQLQSYKTLSAVNDKMELLQQQIQKLVTMLFTQIPEIFTILNVIVDLLRKSVEGWSNIFAWIKGLRGLRLFGGSDGGRSTPTMKKYSGKFGGGDW